MAEIKSTLELVMERTRHLTQSEEEKREQAVAEFKKSVSGLLQKLLDGALAPDHFRDDLLRLQENAQVSDSGIILGEICKRLDLDGDNRGALNLLGEAFGISPQGIADVFAEYLEAAQELAGKKREEIRRDLLEKQGIGGTAVVPNLAADPNWAVEKQRLRNGFESLLAQEVNKLKMAWPS
jgi:hypothetical protein